MTESRVKQDAVDVKPYLVMFSLVYLFGLVFGYTVLHLMKLNSTAGISAAILFASAFVVSIRFNQVNGRSPNKTEKWRLAWGSLIISVVFSIGVLVAVTFLAKGMQGFSDLRVLLGKVNVFVWIGVGILVSALYLLMLQFVYGRGPRRSNDARAIQRR